MALVDEPYYSRGREYYASGHARIELKTEKMVRASCSGTSVYSVVLQRVHGRLSGSCSCPAFSSFGPCKHMAAVGLMLIPNASPGAPSKRIRRALDEEAQKKQMRDNFFDGLNKVQVVGWLYALMNSHPEVKYAVDQDIAQQEVDDEEADMMLFGAPALKKAKTTLASIPAYDLTFKR